MLRGLITSAGVVLAAVFAVLTVLPLVQFIEIGIVVALGVLIDTFLVRSLAPTRPHLQPRRPRLVVSRHPLGYRHDVHAR